MITAKRSGCWLALALVMCGCTPDMEELRREVDKIKQTPPPVLQGIPPMKESDQYAYESNGLRDPFVSGEQSGPGSAVTETGMTCDPLLSPDPNRPKEILEQFPLDALDMVGTMITDGVSYGVIKDPDGVVHRVLAGNYMGQNDGRIVAVYDDRIEIDERMSDNNGCWEAKSAEISLEDSVQ